MREEMNKEVAIMKKELESAFSNFINNEYLSRVGGIYSREYSELYQKENARFHQMWEAMEAIANAAGCKLDRASRFELDEVGIMKIQEQIINAITSTETKPIRKEKLLHMTISFEDGSEQVRVDSKNKEYYEAVLGCYEFEDSDMMEDHIVNEDLIVNEYEKRFGKIVQDRDNNEYTFEDKKNVAKLFDALIEDPSISLTIYSKFLEALLPHGRMSHSSVKWM